MKATPKVATIRKRAGSNGLVACSTFAGCGGSSTGYRWAGYDVRWASEFLEVAADTYAANWPTTILDRRDVRDVTGDEILEAIGVERGELDLFDGSPPCQPFSTAGRRDKNWNREVAHGDGTVNRGGSEDLVLDWCRLVDELRPRAAVMENVRGLSVGKAKGYLLNVLERLAGLGYRVETRLLDAQWLGVPQRRVRTIIVAVRDDVGEPAWPEPHRARVTIASAWPWMDPDREWWLENREVGGFHLRSGWVRIDPRRDVFPTVTSSGYTTNKVRELDGSRRNVTIAECLRVCGFPDDYRLPDSPQAAWARLGNSVPPPMSRAIGEALVPVLAR